MLIRRVRYWLQSSRKRIDLRNEMESHLQERVAELQASGWSEAAAQAEARRLFGNLQVRQEESREIWIARYWSEFWADIRHGSRTLIRQPAFTIAAVAALVLGIGFNAVLFNVYNSLAWEPWAVRNPQQIVQVLTAERNSGSWRGMSWPSFQYVQAHVRSLTGLAGEANLRARVTQGDAAWDAQIGAVSSNFFEVLGTGFSLGRGFSALIANARNQAPEVILNYDTWRARFNANATVIGTWIEVNRERLMVAGVAAPGFNGATILHTDMWVEAGWGDLLQPGEIPTSDPNSCCVSVAGRLRTGVSRGAAQAELTTLNTQLSDSLHRPLGRVLLTRPSFLANPTKSRQSFPIFLALGVMAVLTLLLACANVANLQLARATARRREILLRVSLGAGRGRILRQLVAEGLCVSVIAGTCSMAVSAWLPRWAFRNIAGPDEHLGFAFSNDFRMLTFVVSATVVSALLFGLAPALSVFRDATDSALRDGGGTTSSGRMRSILLAIQVTTCAVLLSGTALLAHSLYLINSVEIGFPFQKLLVMSTGFDTSGLSSDQARSLLSSLRERVTELPGVESAALASRVPYGNQCNATATDAQNRESIPVTLNEVSASFFETMRVPILSGRPFLPSDAATGAVILSEAAAHRFWPNESALGKMLQLTHPSEVIGIVRNFGTREFGSERDVYQVMAATGRCDNLLVARYHGSPGPLIVKMSEQAQELNRRFLPSVSPYSKTIAKARRPIDLAASIASILAGLSLVLALVGVYGVTAYTVTQRTRELGLRMALGARPRSILALVLRENFLTVAIGVAIGIGGAIFLGRLLTGLLYGVKPADPLALLVGSAILFVTSALAAWGPASRAARIDPAVTLRHE